MTTIHVNHELLQGIRETALETIATIEAQISNAKSSLRRENHVVYLTSAISTSPACLNHMNAGAGFNFAAGAHNTPRYTRADAEHIAAALNSTRPADKCRVDVMLDIDALALELKAQREMVEFIDKHLEEIGA